MTNISGCGGPDQSAPVPEGVDTGKETVISGVVTAAGHPVPGAYVRLLDGGGEFTAEVVASPAGDFRFFASPGTWRLRALSRVGNGEITVAAHRGTNDVSLNVGS